MSRKHKMMSVYAGPELHDLIAAAASEAGITKGHWVRRACCRVLGVEDTMAAHGRRYRGRNEPTISEADARQAFDDLKSKEAEIVQWRNDLTARLNRDGYSDVKLAVMAEVSNQAIRDWRRAGGQTEAARSNAEPTISWSEARASYRDLADRADDVAVARSELCRDLFDDGRTDREIGAISGIGANTVGNLRRAYDIGSNLPAETTAEIVRWHKLGLTATEIAPRVGLDVSTVRGAVRIHKGNGKARTPRPKALSGGPKLRTIPVVVPDEDDTAVGF